MRHRLCKDCMPSGSQLFHGFHSKNQNALEQDLDTKRCESLHCRKSWNNVKINSFCYFSYFVSCWLVMSTARKDIKNPSQDKMGMNVRIGSILKCLGGAVEASRLPKMDPDRARKQSGRRLQSLLVALAVLQLLYSVGSSRHLYGYKKTWECERIPAAAKAGRADSRHDVGQFWDESGASTEPPFWVDLR